MDEPETTRNARRAFEPKPPRRLPRGRRRRRIALAALGIFLILVTIALRRTTSHKPVPPGRPIAATVPAPLYPDPPGILFHHSDTPGTVNGRRVDVKVLDRIHSVDHPTWATTFEGKTYHIGYHFVILADGTIQQGRPIHCRGAHCPHYNDWIGICVVGAFSTKDNPSWHPSRPTRKQMASIIWLSERLMSEYHIPPQNVRRHRDCRDTWCPGGRFPYAKIMTQLRAYAAVHPETRPASRALISQVTPAAKLQ